MPELLAKASRPWALRLLPPFPAVANRVLALVNNEDVGSRQISEVINLDPTFTAEILRIANSPLFGVVREISTVQHAVALVGVNKVKAMATLIALSTVVKSSLRIEVLRKFWIHSLVTAVLTDESARAAGAKVDGAYTAGLLHNLGTLGLMSAYPEEYSRMLEVSTEFGFDLIRTERDLFEIDHCAAGACLAEEWNFPDPIVVAIAMHHEEPKKSPNLFSLVQICWRLAGVAGYMPFPDEREWTYEELIELIPASSNSWITGGIERVRQEVGSRLTTLRL
ncbi:MAG TPA: HDOD domain-containing protein [Bryobacteraceae bacterium]|nr:HDOD domain-containing protein [Bryobacteraceae bacterium]